MNANDERLDSWKSIADYLGRDRTTVMRWERDAGLPIHRVAGGRGRSVFAYKSEIDGWLVGHPAEAAAGGTDAGALLAPDVESVAVASAGRESRRTLGIAAGLSLVVVLTTALVLAVGWRERPVVARAQVSEREVVAFDTGGKPLWRFTLPAAERVASLSSPAVADLDDDGRPDVVVALQVGTRDGNEGDGRLLVLDANGREKWQRTLDGQYRFGEVAYGPGWFANDILIYRSAAGVRIAVSQHHHTWWPSILTAYDRDGREVGRFVNAGWILRLKATSDGRHLLAAGLSNSFGGPILAVLDAAAPRGVSPMDGGVLPACLNCPAGSAQRYFVMPWSDLARPGETPPVTVEVAPNGAIEWRATQRLPADGKTPEVIVTLSPKFDVLQRTVDDYFAELHTRLDRAAQIPETAGDWRHPPVREWTPDRGWREIR